MRPWGLTPALRPALWLSLLVTAYSGLAVWKEHTIYAPFGDVPPILEAALSLVIGLLLAFRSNRAFDRWWEGRILWGTLVNASRNLAMKAQHLLASHNDARERVKMLLVAFPYALRDHLRGCPSLTAIQGLEDEDVNPAHVPGWIANQLYGTLINDSSSAQREHLWVLDREARVLMELCGGCERIRNTPIARSYRTFVHQVLAVFLLLLPWSIADDVGFWTFVVAFLTSYLMIGAECIAEHVEQPFGRNGDALDLDGICLGIEQTVNELFAQR